MLYDQAFNDFAESLRLKPDDARAYVYRGDTYYRQGEMDKAIAD